MYETHKEFIIKLITRLYEVYDQNSFAFAKEIAKPNAQGPRVGSCMCPGLSLMSHSCAPNIMRMDTGASLALMVIRKIKKGEQIFDCYR
jgi:hypothetical protein